MRTYEEIEASMAEFELSDKLLLSPDKMLQYSNKWVAAYKGEVVAFDDDLPAVRTELTEKQIPLGTIAIRYIEADGKASCDEIIFGDNV